MKRFLRNTLSRKTMPRVLQPNLRPLPLAATEVERVGATSRRFRITRLTRNRLTRNRLTRNRLTPMWTVLLCGLVAGMARADAPAATSWTLPNGLQVVTYERHTSPLVAVALWVQAGSREERADEIGCAHFLEHTLFKGTTSRRAGDADIAIENLGAVLDAATGPDYAVFYTTVGSLHMGKALDILEDVIANPTLPEIEIEHERGVILDELAQHDADPTACLVDLLYANSFPSHPYGRSPGGTQSAIRALHRDSLLAFYHRCYAPTRCTLVLVGDCTPEQFHQEAQRAFAGWRVIPQTASAREAAALPKDDRAVAPPSPPPASRLKEVRAATPYPMVGLAYPAPTAGDLQMACAGMVAATLLGDARSGRLALPRFTGTEAAARYTPRLDTGLLTITARVPNAAGAAAAPALERLEADLVKSVRDLQDVPPTQDEFNAARRLLLGRLQFDTETGAGLARALGYAQIVGGEAPDALRARIRRLTRADLQRYCQNFLAGAHAITLRLRPTTDITSRTGVRERAE